MRATLPCLSLLLIACAAETPADDMPADIFTKALAGDKFLKFRSILLGK